jgi:hypothetical protein
LLIGVLRVPIAAQTRLYINLTARNHRCLIVFSDCLEQYIGRRIAEHVKHDVHLLETADAIELTGFVIATTKREMNMSFGGASVTHTHTAQTSKLPGAGSRELRDALLDGTGCEADFYDVCKG